MISLLVRVSRKLTYTIGYRRFARNPNPAVKARVWPRIGVLQLPLTSFAYFWLRHPLFWIGLHILLGTGAATRWGYALFPLAAVLWVPYILQRSWQRLIPAALLFLCSWWGASSFFEHRELPANGLEGILYFSISQVKPLQTPFGAVLSYQGQASGFLTSEKKRISKVPCQIILRDCDKRPKAVCDYLVSGRLHKTRKGGYLFKPDRHTSWQPVEKSHSFAEWRLQFKRKIASFIKLRFGKTPCSALFASLATGDIDERTLAIEFSRLGLSHILAISGFHFALLASFLLFCLGWLLPFRTAKLTVLGLVGVYLFFLGFSPSVMRAFCAISIALIGKASLLRSNGINALGAGLVLVLLLDPPLCQNLGFQLSFLCTAALLLLYDPCEKLIAFFFLQRTVAGVSTMSRLDQHGSLLAALLRKALALTLAVHIATLPVCLFHFSTFPLFGSLLYNLFFPTLLAFSLLLLISGVILDCVFPWLGQLLHTINREFTNFLLHSITYAPPVIKGTISLGTIPPFVIALWLSSLLFFAIVWKSDTARH